MTHAPLDARAFAARAATTVLSLDFDGTLVPIVPDPEDARADDATRALLERLAARFAAVAIVSGRPAAFVAERTGARGVRYFGLYGLQESRDGVVRSDPRLAESYPRVRAAKAALEADPDVRASGAYVEDKEFSVALHARRIDDPGAYSQRFTALADALARRFDLAVEPGKLVWELRPPVRADKGDAVARVVRECDPRALLVAGDDLGDVAAFDAAHALRADGVDVTCVAIVSTETPARVRAAADATFSSPAEFLAFLQRIASEFA